MKKALVFCIVIAFALCLALPVIAFDFGGYTNNYYEENYYGGDADANASANASSMSLSGAFANVYNNICNRNTNTNANFNSAHQSQSLNNTIINEKNPINTPVAPNEYVGTHYEGRADIITEDVSSILDADEVRVIKRDSWCLDKINYDEIPKVYFRELAKLKVEWAGYDISYVIVRHPRVLGAGLNLADALANIYSTSGNTVTGMLGFSSVGEKDKFEIYFLKKSKTPSQ